MPNVWKREKNSLLLISLRGLLLFLLVASLTILIFSLPRSSKNPNPNPDPSSLHLQRPILSLPIGTPLHPFDCAASPQASPVFAARVEGLHYPFLYSLADFGSLPEKPHKNIVRMLKGKPFRRPDISFTIQELLHGSKPSDGIVIDVGANVGMAAFAAAAMGFRVVAFEPVSENLQRICDGVFLNRFWDRVMIFEAAASDRIGNITFHKAQVGTKRTSPPQSFSPARAAHLLLPRPPPCPLLRTELIASSSGDRRRSPFLRPGATQEKITDKREVK